MDSSTQFIAASDSRFRYEGRFDVTNPAGPVVIWQGSRIRIDFAGDQLAFLFDGQGEQSFFDVQVDESKFILEIRNGTNQRFKTPQALAPGWHKLTLFKRSEAAAGTVRFRGIEIAAGASAWPPAPTAYKLTMEFFGDSITVGACNEDGNTDQWDNRRTHNNAQSYAAMTAAAFSADYRNIAVSGMGVITGYVNVRAGQIWDRLYPEAASARADLKAWTPDVVFVNFGENDDSFSRSQGKPFPSAYTDGYVSLVQAIRGAYPKARIVLLRGGMYGGSQSAALRGAWETAVARLEAADAGIRHFVFTHWSSNHPRVADHRAMADELIDWLKKQNDLGSRLGTDRSDS
jgi:lysophospholipase L1-like esterase